MPIRTPSEFTIGGFLVGAKTSSHYSGVTALHLGNGGILAVNHGFDLRAPFVKEGREQIQAVDLPGLGVKSPQLVQQQLGVGRVLLLRRR